MPSEESATAAFIRAGQDAVTYARRVAREALARNERHRAGNAELAENAGRGRIVGETADATPPALRAAAKQFRRARGLAVPEFPALVDPVPLLPEPLARATRTGEDEEDFSQMRIMKRDL